MWFLLLINPFVEYRKLFLKTFVFVLKLISVYFFFVSSFMTIYLATLNIKPLLFVHLSIPMSFVLNHYFFLLMTDKAQNATHHYQCNNKMKHDLNWPLDAFLKKFFKLCNELLNHSLGCYWRDMIFNMNKNWLMMI